MSLVEARGVRVRRGDRVVLDDVDASVAAGEVVAVVGPNGAGKSTLVAALAGDLVPTSGRVLLAGREVAAYSSRELARRRSVLLQHPVLGSGLRVRDVVAMGRAPWDPGADDAAVLARAVRAADVAHLLDRPVAALSGGEAARVALARVLAQDAPLMLWDEPTAALDLTHQVSVLETARAAASAGVGLLVVLHDLGLAAAYADRVVLLVDGRVAACGDPGDVLRPAVLEPAYRMRLAVLDHPRTGRPVVVPA
ncbi:MAG: heme ABC transporter ATP-binding protein [Candidatus Nanopelagicales bacterium]